MQAAHTPTVRRAIHFYRVDWLEFGDDGVLTEVPDPQPAFDHIDKLPADYSADSHRYLALRDGNEILMAMDELAPEPQGKIAAKRRNKLPPIEEDGSYTPLVLSGHQGLAEIRHFVYFPERQILGIEFNHYAPRISRWCEYLVAKTSPLLEHVTVQMVLAGDARRTLEQFERLTMAEVGVRAARVEDIPKGTSLRKVMRALRAGSNAQELRLEVKLGTRKRDVDLEAPFIEDALAMAEDPERREALTALSVNGRDSNLGRSRRADLLEDAMVRFASVAAVSQEANVVVSEAMYEAIRGAYAAIADELSE